MGYKENAGRYSPKGLALNLFSMCVFVTPVARGVPMPSASHRWRRVAGVASPLSTRADYSHDARLPGVGLALEGQRGPVPRHVRDAALGLEEAAPLLGPAAPAVAGHAAGALVVRRLSIGNTRRSKNNPDQRNAAGGT